MKIKEFFLDLAKGIKEVFQGKPDEGNLFKLNGRTPFLKAIPFGIQHVLAMFTANIVPILIVFGSLGIVGEFGTSSMLGALFMAGIGTIIQLFIGARLPIVIGTSFTFVPIFLTIGFRVLNGGGTGAEARRGKGGG